MSESSRHDLDEAIDRVAAKMVAVDGADILQAVMARLPERAATPWFLAMPVQLAAATAVLLAAFLSARPSREVTPVDGPEFAVAAPVVTPTPEPGSLIPVIPPAVARQAWPRRVPVAIDQPDHERSLAPVEAINAIELSGIAPPAMEIDAAVALEPLVLPELALDTQGDS